jgi:hypothetical protein
MNSVGIDVTCRCCGVLFFICRACWRGQTYCSCACRQKSSDAGRRAAGRRYQDGDAGRRRHTERQRRYLRPDLLVIDEVGYLSFDSRAADLLFEVVSRRYESGPIILTTNLAFKDWPTIFPGAACVTAMVDRLTHHAEIIAVEGESYRCRESKERQKQRGRRQKTKEINQ